MQTDPDTQVAEMLEYHRLTAGAMTRYDYLGQRGGTHAQCMTAAADAEAPTGHGLHDVHPTDCGYCATGEPMQHNYEGPS